MLHQPQHLRRQSTAIEGVQLFHEALPGSLFERLTRAVRSTGRKRLKRNYTTTFWLPRDTEPTNVAEAAVQALADLVQPGPEVIGMEWWLGRLRYGQKLRMHFDRDMRLRKETGRFVHPVWGSALFLNPFPSSPLVLTDQVPGPDGEGRVPPKPTHRLRIAPESNLYATFPGGLRHGVIPREETGDDRGHPELRLSFLVNFWSQRPMPPLCGDFDPEIYPQIASAT